MRQSRRFTIRDFYKSSELLQKQDYKKVKEIWDTFATVLSKSLIETGVGYKLPYLLGVIQMRKQKTKPKAAIDFNKTRLLGVKVYHQNKHSDGYYGFLYWDTTKPNCQMPYKGIYKLEFVRDNKRYVARQIKENNVITKYFEIS